VTSSDLIVSISWRVYTAEYASSAHTSISQNLCHQLLALPHSGCCVMSEYGHTDLAWILSSTICTSLMMYMYQIVTGFAYLVPVLPSYTSILPSAANPAAVIIVLISSAPKSEKSGTANLVFIALAINHSCISNACHIFIREITHSGLRHTSICSPSAVYGISSSGTTIAMIPLFPCLPASLSHTSIFLVLATYTLIFFFTPALRLSHFLLSSTTTSITFP